MCVVHSDSEGEGEGATRASKQTAEIVGNTTRRTRGATTSHKTRAAGQLDPRDGLEA